MRAQLVTIQREQVVSVRNVEIADDYDGDPYGDKVPFAVGSNQYLRTDSADFTDEM